jgi:hypothetical protein
LDEDQRRLNFEQIAIDHQAMIDDLENERLTVIANAAQRDRDQRRRREDQQNQHPLYTGFEIAYLPEVHEERYENLCPICHVEFVRNELLFLTDCQHLFHSNCW